MTKPLSPLTLRVLTALVGMPLLVVICLWGAVPFTVFTLVLALLARGELQRAYELAGIHPNRFLSLLGALAPGGLLLLRPYLTSGNPSTALSLYLLLASGLIVASLAETGRASHTTAIHTGRNLAYGLLCGTYVSLFGGLALLRLSTWHGSQGHWPSLEGGASLFLVTAACTIATDSGAFFAGRAFGRHKLAEGISPKKTTEGLIGGIVLSVLVGWGVAVLLLGAPVFGLVVGALAGILGPLGDLFKSALKREIGIKDFGSLLPGHGGILDRFDSLLFTAPVVVLLVDSGAFSGG